MIHEIEEGELSSDQDGSGDNDNRIKLSKDDFNRDLVLNNEEKSVLKKLIESGTESGELSDENANLRSRELDNPYAEEDVSGNFLTLMQPRGSFFTPK